MTIGASVCRSPFYLNLKISQNEGIKDNTIMMMYLLLCIIAVVFGQCPGPEEVWSNAEDPLRVQKERYIIL